MFSFVLTFFAYDWMAYGGVKHTMIILGSIQVGICCLSIPMCKSSPEILLELTNSLVFQMFSASGTGLSLRAMIFSKFFISGKGKVASFCYDYDGALYEATTI